LKSNAEKLNSKGRRISHKKRRITIFFIVLFVIFLFLESPLLWKAMYPVYYKNEIAQSSSKHKVDPFLVMAIIQIESKFDKKQVSNKGAIGLMQVMPSTAKWAAKQGDFSPMAVEYLDEPATNIDIGSWYVSFLYQKFNGNPYAVIAAYNAGPGNVSRWLAQGIWDGKEETISRIPFGETRHYIQRVLYYKDRYAKIYKDDFS
jgi:soluble lytic murein transglycosylase